MEHYFRKHAVEEYGDRKWRNPGIKIDAEEFE
jgi:hypothetical protein